MLLDRLEIGKLLDAKPLPVLIRPRRQTKNEGFRADLA